jgi:excisionase family DNA binding protein
MRRAEYLSIAEVAKMLGISRIAVYMRVKKGKIKAIRIGKSYAIPKEYAEKNFVDIVGSPLEEEGKKDIKKSVERTIKEYREVLQRLGSE